MITKVVKVTHVQMQTLLNGGTVAGHTYDPTHCLYIEDTGAELPTESGSFMLSSSDGGQTFSYTSPLVEFDGEDVAGLHAMVAQNPAIQFVYEDYIYSPVCLYPDIPFVYSSMQAGEDICYIIQFDWDEETFTQDETDILTLGAAQRTYLPIQVYEVDAVTRPLPAQGTNYVVYHITAPSITSLTEGLTVRVHKPLASVFPNDSNGAVKLLQINNLTPIALFWRYNTMLTWNQLDNVYMTLTYSSNARPSTADYYGYTRADGFILDYTYDSGNDVSNLYSYGPFQTGSLQLTTNSITGVDIDGKRIPIIQQDGTFNTTVPFLIHAGVTYYDGGTLSANRQYGSWNGQFWLRRETALFRSAFLAATGLSAATNNTVAYLKCSISGITATPVAITTALPTSADGYYYIYLMRAYDLYTGTGSNRYWTFELDHPIYCYRNGELIEVTNTLEASAAGNAAAGKIVSRNANGTIQSEKVAISVGTTTKATIQYNSEDDCVEFIFA